MNRLALVTAMLAACAPVQELGAGAIAVNRDQVWTLQTLRGEKLRKNVVTLRLNPDRTISGTAACNSTLLPKLRWTGKPGAMHGAFDRLGHGAGISTTALCRDRDAVAIADQFWDSMEMARAWYAGRRSLLIKFADGSEAYLVLVKR